jgi:2-C-methyl-D-erythritol 4-phosphate cytidylyltransferase/2-C-methyl-D-erythritol 2,4-cyclodiphosphate synthase
MKLSAILLAAGAGTRFGGAVPKQFLHLAGAPVLRHAAERLAAAGVLLQPVGDAAVVEPALAGIAHLPVIPGGAERQDSVRAGLEALASHAPDLVLVHDGARPFIPPGTIEAVIAALADYEGAIPALPVSDTLKRGENGVISGTVSRENLFRAQTPQGFRFPTLLRLHRDSAGLAATDDAALLEAAGLSVALTPGSEQNIKLTVTADFARLEQVFQEQVLKEAPMIPRIGTGFDVHAMAEGRKMIICGIDVPHEKGLAGHSDADVGIHALCDAIYGALAEGDIGRHFPPSENTWKDADSARFLRHAAERIAARGGRLANADITIICERPKITPHAPAMRARLAELLGVGIDLISVKATTSEKLGFTGRGEGIAAQAAVIVLLPE